MLNLATLHPHFYQAIVRRVLCGPWPVVNQASRPGVLEAGVTMEQIDTVFIDNRHRHLEAAASHFATQ
jgi:hypothetical protein